MLSVELRDEELRSAKYDEEDKVHYSELEQ